MTAAGGRLPFTVEKWVTIGPLRPRWVVVLDVPRANLRDAERWLRAQGIGWAKRVPWRIVNRAGDVVKEFSPDPLRN